MITEQLTEAIADALGALGVVAPDEIGLERPARKEHGDWSSNVAMVVAKGAGRNPRELAEAICAHIGAAPPGHVTGVAVAGPGFVNFWLAPTWLHDTIPAVVDAGIDDYARSKTGAGRTVNVEFISANPNKPIHAGHGRGACFGDAVARLLERTGHAVQRECYLNDRGVQMKLFAASLAARQRGHEPPADGYHGEYVTQWAAELPADADPLDWGYERALRSHRETAERLRIWFDVWFSERSMVDSGAIEATLAELRELGVVFEAEGATWLRSSDYGDDKDRVLVKSDGELTYLTPDIAYHRDKFTRAERLINVWGADHHGYISRLQAAMHALGHDAGELEIIVTQLVDLVRDGQQVAMAGRSGDLIELDWLLDEVGVDATRFTYLMQSVDSRQSFDLDLVTSQSMDNPVYYVQYAHARIHSIGREAAQRDIDRRPLTDVDLSVLTAERELDLLRALYELPELVEYAARERAPHRVATWLRETAGAFHGFYHDCPILRADVDPGVRQARLWLTEATRIGLVVGLDLLGVAAPESM